MRQLRSPPLPLQLELDLRVSDEEPEEAASSRAAGRRRNLAVLVVVGLIDLTANAFAVVPLHVGTFGALPGLFLLIIGPAWLVQPALRDRLDPILRYALGPALAVAGVMVSGLVVDAVLPLLGDPRPLSTMPLLVASDVGTVVLAVAGFLLSRREGRPYVLWAPAPGPGRGLATSAALTVSLAGVALAAAGSTRLNNGLGDRVALAALVVVCATAGYVLFAEARLSDFEVGVLLFAMAASLLLLIAMRGWFVTGPDSQGEYAVYHAVAQAGRWTPRSVNSAYNACLSVTILPQVLSSVSGISGVYVWKTVIPLLFALTPVFVFVAARHVVSRRPAVLAAIIFLTFPTFVYSLAFAARQEVAFVFVGAASALAASQKGRTRDVLHGICLAGVLLSHYSTSYYLFTSAALAWGALHVLRWRRRRTVDLSTPRPGRPTAAAGSIRLLGWRTLACFGVGIVLWNGALNGITGHAETVVAGAAAQFVGHGSRPTPVPFVAGQGVKVTGSLPLAEYAAAEESHVPRLDVQRGYFAQKALQTYAVSPAAVLDAPLTAAGRALARLGLPPGAFNGLIRSVIKHVLETFAVLGTGLFLWRARRRMSPYAVLAAANLVVVGATLVLPTLSAAYGAARAFQQALFVLAPCISIVLYEGLRRFRVPRPTVVAGVVSVAAVTSLSGLLPQLTGGYIAQLDLDNTGVYYANYYTTPQELAVASWLDDQGVTPVQMNRYMATRLSTRLTMPILNDDFPDVVRVNSFLVVGSSTLATGAAPATGTLFYTYPFQFVTQAKSRIYASSGAQVYK